MNKYQEALDWLMEGNDSCGTEWELLQELVDKTDVKSEDEEIATDKIAQHKNLLNRLHETYKEKNHKYGDSFTDTIQKYGLVAGLSRMHDKFSRIENIILDKAEDDAEERLEDSLLDLANYCIMTVMAINETSKVGDDD